MSKKDFLESAMRGLLILEKGGNSKFNKLEVTKEELGMNVLMDGQFSAIILAIYSAVESIAYSDGIHPKNVLFMLHDLLAAKEYGEQSGEPVSELREHIDLQQLEDKLEKLFGEE